MANISKALVRTVLRILAVVFGLLLCVLIFFQTNTGKNWATRQVLEYVGKRSDHRLTLQEAHIDWFDRVTIHDLKVYDRMDSVMVSARTVTVNYSLTDLISRSLIRAEAVALADASLNLRKYNDSSAVNLLLFLRDLAGTKKKKDQPALALSNLQADKWSVSYKDYRLDSTGIRISQNLFNPAWFDFNIDELEAEDLWLRNDSLEVDIVRMSGVEAYSGFPVTSFTADVGLYPRALILDRMQMNTHRSRLSDSLALSYQKPANLAYLKDSVNIYLRLRDCILSLDDLAYFGEVPRVEEQWTVSGVLHGKVSNLDLSDIHIDARDGSSLYLDASLFGLPRISETFMDIRIHDSQIAPDRISPLLSGLGLNLGSTGFHGSLVGFVNDFVAYGTIHTPHGTLKTDINLKLGEEIANSRYIGNLSFRQFDMGKLLDNDLIGTLDFDGGIDGFGFTSANAVFELTASARNMVLDGYSYDTIIVRGDFKANFFDGSLEVSDGRGRLSGRATVDFSHPEEVIDLDIAIDSLDLLAYGLARRPTWFSSKLLADLREININQTHGSIRLARTFVVNDHDYLELDSTRLSITLDTIKSYRLVSDLIDATLSGDFLLTELVRELPQNIRAYRSYFTLGEGEPARTGGRDGLNTTLEVTLKNPNPFFRLIDVPVSLSQGSHIAFSYNHKNDISFDLYASIDTLRYRDRFFYENELLVNASKDADSPDILALMQLSSSGQQWNRKIATEDFALEAIWSQEHIASSLKIAQKKNNNYAHIRSILSLGRDTITFKVLPSDLIVFDRKWAINRHNEVTILRNKSLIHDMAIYKGSQLVSIEGVWSDSLPTLLAFEFVDFDLLNLSSLSPREIGGIIDARGRLSRLSGQYPLRFETDISIRDLSFEGIPVGDLNGFSEWDRTERGLYIDYAIKNQSINTIDLNGYFRPFEADQLDLQASFDQANLKLIEPLFETLISDLEGEATGELSLTGRLARPRLRGVSTVDNGRVTIDYLNTEYHFSGVTRFFEQQVAFDNIEVYDRFNHLAYLNGAVNHNQFEDIFMNVSLNFTDFELLNTNKQHNPVYYGNAYATGRMEMIGPVENILFTAEGSTSPNTRIFIPLIEESSAAQVAFITFKSPDTSTVQEEALDLTGINIDFDMTITPDAYIELIFNPRTGDIIRGRGNGNLQLKVNSSGDFDLFGKYTVQSGAYNFTTAVFNKEFKVLPGGTIDWYGDPYGGQMDITASYRQLADISDWQSSAGAIVAPSQPAQKRPVLVMLDINGPMMSPDISFHLELEDQSNPDLSSDWSQSIASINANEEELKRQVFSLLVLRKFSEREGFIVGGQNTLSEGFTNSVSEFLSNQLSYWLNQVDENLEIDFDLNSLSADAFNTFQLRLAYSFLDGRLRVTRGGGITTIVDEGVNADLQSILGDWSVEYILTENGKLRARFFSRNNQYVSGTQSASVQQGQETGLSLQYVTSFDEFSNILKNSRKSASPEEGADQSPQ